jgi:hypothetical protein
LSRRKPTSALINALRDQFVIEAKSADPLPDLKWDVKSLDALKTQYEQESASYSSYSGMQDPRGEVNEETRYIAAAAWGLFPEKDATYLNYDGGFGADQCYRATYQVPPNDAFWSITVYGDSGYLESDKPIKQCSHASMPLIPWAFQNSKPNGRACLMRPRQTTAVPICVCAWATGYRS